MTTIAVFGGGAISQEERDYIDAQTIGRLLAESTWVVMTGGYTGIMEAASRGAAEAGGHVIGITLTEAERGNYPPDANAWVKEEIRYETVRQRLLHLVNNADAYVILRGSRGTALELLTVWEKMANEEMPLKPVICLGETWRGMVRQLAAQGNNAKEILSMIQFTDSPETALDILKARLE